MSETGDLAPISTEDEARVAEIVDVVVAIAANQFDRRAHIGDGTHVLDGLAAGVNMLAEEIAVRIAREQAMQQQIVQNERLVAVGQLAAGVAHEVNNPATFVLANLRTLLDTVAQMTQETSSESPGRDSSLGTLAQQLARESLAGVERIVAIVRELRSFSRTDRAPMQALDLADVVRDALPIVHGELSPRVRLAVHLLEGLRVSGDRTRLGQVFTNLLLNAIQAIPEHGTTAHAVELRMERSAGLARVFVRDTGTGLTDDAQAHLFEPFFTTKPRELGTGLGLPISADIVRQHAGELRLVETSSRGTTFEVTLPLQEEPQHATLAAPTVASLTAPTVGVTAVTGTPPRLRILMIDDEAMLLTTFARSLGVTCDVETALGGEAAIARLEHDTAWDAVVCDVMMPGIDGLAVHEWVRAHRPALVDRLLFCTGGSFTPRTTAFVEQLGERILEKPFTTAELLGAIARVTPRVG